MGGQMDTNDKNTHEMGLIKTRGCYNSLHSGL